MDTHTLTIDYAGETYRIEPDRSLEFGRNAELDIDSNQYLHRHLGRFEHRNDIWFLSNIGRSLHITVLDPQTQSQAIVAPGREYALTYTPAHIRFRAGRVTYQLIVTCTAPTPLLTTTSETTFDTITHSSIPLTRSQRLLIVSLAEPTLRDPASGIQMPTSRQTAARIDWTITKFNRKIDNVCAKLTKAGVVGLHGTPTAIASNRRRLLVEFAIQSGLVTTDDLDLLADVTAR